VTHNAGESPDLIHRDSQDGDDTCSAHWPTPTPRRTR
jgi:hypothetical protein